MNIFIPFKIKDAGGTSIFAKKFSDAIIKEGHNVFFNFRSNFDIIFIIADSPLRYVFYAKIRGKKIIQRLDGVYHPGVTRWPMHLLYNFKMRIIRNIFADYIIYQSKFSKLSCDKMLGKTSKNFEIIYNGVDVKKIKPISFNNGIEKINLLTFAVFRRKDQISPIIEAIKNMDEGYHLDIYGSYTENLSEIFNEIKKIKNISWKGKVTNENLLSMINKYDIFIFSDQSACPNSVLEALASGLPVVAYDRGSISELIKNGQNGEYVELKNIKAFEDSFPFSRKDFLDLSERIARVSRNLHYYKKMARKSAEHNFSLEKMIENYLEVFIIISQYGFKKK